jgi:hypothetical protein
MEVGRTVEMNRRLEPGLLKEGAHGSYLEEVILIS